MEKLIIDSTNHGKDHILKVDLKRLLKDQETWDNALKNIQGKRKIETPIWEKFVKEVSERNGIDLKASRDPRTHIIYPRGMVPKYVYGYETYCDGEGNYYN